MLCAFSACKMGNIGSATPASQSDKSERHQHHERGRSKVLFFLQRTWTLMVVEKWSRTRTRVQEDRFRYEGESQFSRNSFCSCSQCQRDDGFSTDSYRYVITLLHLDYSSRWSMGGTIVTDFSAINMRNYLNLIINALCVQSITKNSHFLVALWKIVAGLCSHRLHGSPGVFALFPSGT